MKRLMLGVAVAALLPALYPLLDTSPALAAAPTTAAPGACMSAKSWVTDVRQKSEGVSVQVLSDIQGIEARAVVDRINATPPETNMRADHVIVLGARVLADNVPAPYVLVAFFDHDCLVTSGRADPAQAANMLAGESI